MAFTPRAGDKVDDFGRGRPEDKPRTQTASAIGMRAMRGCRCNKRHKEPRVKSFKLALQYHKTLKKQGNLIRIALHIYNMCYFSL